MFLSGFDEGGGGKSILTVLFFVWGGGGGGGHAHCGSHARGVWGHAPPEN